VCVWGGSSCSAMVAMARSRSRLRGEDDGTTITTAKHHHCNTRFAQQHHHGCSFRTSHDHHEITAGSHPYEPAQPPQIEPDAQRNAPPFSRTTITIACSNTHQQILTRAIPETRTPWKHLHHLRALRRSTQIGKEVLRQ